MSRSAQRRVLGAQAGYYVVSGGFAFARGRLFRRLAGVKGSHLIVEENGALFAAVGTVLALGARSPQPDRSAVRLGLLVPAVTSAVVIRNHREAPRPFFAEMLTELAFAVALALTSRDSSAPNALGADEHAERGRA